jgi:putative addiction module killer protein
MIVTIEFYEEDNGNIPLKNWLDSLKDDTAVDIILGRLHRLSLGLFGNWRIIKTAKNLFELKINYGPGYRLYYGKKGDSWVLLLAGSTKKDQKAAIKLAKKYWKEYLSRS